MSSHIRHSKQARLSLNLKGQVYELENRPLVMGIMNLTPDSFYAGSRTALSPTAVSQRAEQMIEEGADIIDLGAYSTRPGAAVVSLEEEWKRLRMPLELLSKSFSQIPLSVDTFRAEIARRAADYGASIINDVSGGTLDAEMFKAMADIKLPYVLMHMRGTPKTMSRLTDYNNVTLDVIEDLRKKAEELRAAGFSADLIIDPGFGFSKDREQNYEMMRELSYFKVLQMPILVGISRKSMIWGLLGTSPEESLNGSSVLHTVALLNGAHILRVHDVKAAVEVVKVVQAIQSPH